jgi:hypothetical protein
MMHPYVLEPKLTFTVGLYTNPKQYADQESSIGEVIGHLRKQPLGRKYGKLGMEKAMSIRGSYRHVGGVLFGRGKTRA